VSPLSSSSTTPNKSHAPEMLPEFKRTSQPTASPSTNKEKDQGNAVSSPKVTSTPPPTPVSATKVESPVVVKRDEKSENVDKKKVEPVVVKEKVEEVKSQTEVKPQAEIKPQEEKPAQTKAEVKPQEEKKAEVKPQEEKKVEAKPQEEKKAEVKPQEEKKVEVKPQEEKKAEAEPQEEKKAEVKPQEEKKPEVKPQVEAKPQEEKPAQTKAEVKPTETKPEDKSQAKPDSETKPTQTSEPEKSETSKPATVSSQNGETKEAAASKQTEAQEDNAGQEISDADQEKDTKRTPISIDTIHKDEAEKSEDDEDSWENKADSDKDDKSSSDDESKSIFYPDGAMWRPDNAGGSKNYGKDFLMQFKELCTARPDNLPSDLISEALPSSHMNRSNSFHKSSGGRGMRESRDRLRTSGTNSPGMSSKNGRNSLKSSSERKMRKSSSSGLNLRPPGELVGLSQSANKWIPTKFTSIDAQQAVTRKAQGLLNKMSEENFESLSEKLLDVGIDSAEILEGILKIIFEKALTEAKFRGIYANLCQKLSVKCPSFGPELTFKRLLLGQCQEVFESSLSEAKAERGDISKLSKDEQEQKLIGELMAKKKVIGNIVFIGELFKRQMLNDKIMTRCIHELMGDASEAQPEDLESLCVMLNGIGQQLDQGTSKAKIEMCFMYLTDVLRHKKVSSRITFMIQDVLLLRKNNWVPRGENKSKPSASVTTILQRDKTGDKGRGAINSSGQNVLRKSSGASGGLRTSQSGASSGRSALTKSKQGNDDKPNRRDNNRSNSRSSGKADIPRMIEEYFNARDGTRRLMDDLKTMPPASHSEFIKELLLYALDNECDKRQYCQETVDLLNRINREDVIDKDSMRDGYEGATEATGAIVDSSSAKVKPEWAINDLSTLIGYALYDNCMELSSLPYVLKSIVNNKSIPARDVAVQSFKLLEKKLGSTELRVLISKEKFRIYFLFPGEEKTKAHNYFNEKGLSGLFEINDDDDTEREDANNDVDRESAHTELLDDLKIIIEKGDKNQIMNWADESADEDTLADEKFSGTALHYMIQMTHKKSNGNVNEMTNLIESLTSAFKLFLSSTTLQTNFVYEMQHFCASLDFPEGMMEKLLDNAYEVGLVGRKSVQQWLQGEASEEKTRALGQISQSFLSDFD